MNFANITIRSKLYCGFGVMAAIPVVLVAVAYMNVERLAQAENLNTRSYDTLRQTQAILESLSNIQTGERGFALTGADSFLKPLEEGKKSFESSMEKARMLTGDSAAQQARLRKLQEEKDKWLKVAIDPMLKMRKGVTAGAIEMESLVAFEQGGRGEQSINNMRELLGEINATEEQRLAERSQNAASLRDVSRALLIGGGSFAAVLAALLAWFLVRRIVTPLSQAVTLAKTVAAGDLTSRIAVHAQDETGELLQALKDMNDSLAHIVGRVRAGTDAIAAVSSEIASGNADVSAHTESQANSLQRTASSIEDLTATVRQNAESAKRANQLAISASAHATTGGNVVGQVVDTMESIKESSHRIADIIGVIDGIAFQTNILALNAAVEAAHAGEQGRGFAVVASEVRSLAQRSAAAAMEIKALIRDSAEKVDAGGKLVSQAGATMTDIVNSIRDVTEIMSEIATASEEQSAGIVQFSQAIGHIDEMAQQNAALVGETASAAENLQDQAMNLSEAVRAFRLNTDHAPGLLSSGR